MATLTPLPCWNGALPLTSKDDYPLNFLHVEGDIFTVLLLQEEKLRP